MNVLGAANFNMHIEGERPLSIKDLQGQVRRTKSMTAAFVNWNNTHWSVLEMCPYEDIWIHTNSVQGEHLRHGRRELYTLEAVHNVLEEIEVRAGAFQLFLVTSAQPGLGESYAGTPLPRVAVGEERRSYNPEKAASPAGRGEASDIS